MPGCVKFQIFNAKNFPYLFQTYIYGNIELYEKAKPYYEKAKELKPDNKALWGNYLLNIYWKLNRAEYDSLEKELGY